MHVSDGKIGKQGLLFAMPLLHKLSPVSFVAIVLEDKFEHKKTYSTCAATSFKQSLHTHTYTHTPQKKAYMRLPRLVHRACLCPQPQQQSALPEVAHIRS